MSVELTHERIEDIPSITDAAFERRWVQFNHEFPVLQPTTKALCRFFYRFGFADGMGDGLEQARKTVSP